MNALSNYFNYGIYEFIKNNKAFLITIFFVSLVFRLLIFHFFLTPNNNYMWGVDSQQYHEVAVNFAKSAGYCNASGQPDFLRVPGYPFFLSIFYKLFGINTYIPMITQIIFSSFLPILIFLLSLIFFPQQILIARIAALVATFQIGLAIYSGLFMTESIFILFFILFSIFYFKNFYIPSYFNVFISGILLGLISLIRPVGQYFVIICFLLLFIFISGRLISKLKYSITFLFGWLIIIIPLLIRNFILLGHLFFHTLPGGHFLQLQTTQIIMQEKNCNYKNAFNFINEEAKKRVEKKENEFNRKLNEIEVCKIKEKLAFEYVLKHPVCALKITANEIFKTLFGKYTEYLCSVFGHSLKDAEYFDTKRTASQKIKRYLMPDVNNDWVKFFSLYEILMFALILVGFIIFIFNFVIKFFSKGFTQEFPIIFTSLIFIGLFAFLSCASGYARFRIPIEPFLIILASNFWSKFLTLKKGA